MIPKRSEHWIQPLQIVAENTRFTPLFLPALGLWCNDPYWHAPA